MSGLLVTGASVLGEGTTDLYVVDGRFADPSSADRDTSGDIERVDAVGLIACQVWSICTPTSASPGARTRRRSRPAPWPRPAGAIPRCSRWRIPTPVTDTGEAAEHLLELGRRHGHCQVVPIGAVSKGLAGAELAELGLMARGAAAGPGVLRRRLLRYRRPADAPRAGVRSRLRRLHRPACPGPGAGRTRRLLPRG